jgi:hypothetical protein
MPRFSAVLRSITPLSLNADLATRAPPCAFTPRAVPAWPAPRLAGTRIELVPVTPEHLESSADHGHPARSLSDVTLPARRDCGGVKA